MINIPKGTKDVIPSQSYLWHYVEDAARDTARIFGFREVRTPTFEHTELFLRGVGDTTDIVNKEMYTFEDKAGRSITLKPEGTAGVGRSFIENNLANTDVLPLKMFYLTPVFRYEKPQAGRLREHHQFGVEVYGSPSPETDAEVILLAKTFFEKLGVTDLTVNINSIGCKECRMKYNAALKDYLRSNLENMCGSCQERFEKNPLRVLDCKVEACAKINANAPSILDYICDECKDHFERLQGILTDCGVNFKVNPRIVRGLDYYSKTVFEFISNGIGAQGTVCGGGRYDTLLEHLGGKATPAVGFGLGLERLLLVLENLNLLPSQPPLTQFFVAALGENAKKFVTSLVYRLRKAGISADFDVLGRSVKAQFKFADKLRAPFVIVIGDDELANGTYKLKNMQTGEESFHLLNEIETYLKTLATEKGEMNNG